MRDNSCLYEEEKERTTLVFYEKVDFTVKIFHVMKQKTVKEPLNFLKYFHLKYVETCATCWLKKKLKYSVK